MSLFFDIGFVQRKCNQYLVIFSVLLADSLYNSVIFSAFAASSLYSCAILCELLAYSLYENLKRDLKELGIGFEHVAITKEQIVQYGLENLTNPDPTVMAKLRRDSNANFFRSQNDGKLFQIEVDALNALRPEDFVTLLEDSVDKYFDEEIYDGVMADPKHSAASIGRLLHKSIKKFSGYEKAYNEKKKKEKTTTT